MAYLKLNHIDTIISFDGYGISGHSNHVAIFKALEQGCRDGIISQRCFKLVSVSILAKFLFLLSALLNHLNLLGVDSDTSLSFLSTFSQYLVARKAMHTHKSQMVWFRHLYLLSSMYMIGNHLESI